MATKVIFAFLVAVVLFQVITWSMAARITRDTSDDTSKTVNELINSVKSGLEEFVKNVKSNELLRNATQTLEGFAQSVKSQGDDLIDKIKKSAN